jgi:hypothetical protein
MPTLRFVISYFFFFFHCVHTILTIALLGRTIFALHAMMHTFAFQVYSSNTDSLPRHRWRWSVSITFRPLFPYKKNPSVRNEHEAGSAPQPGWTFWRRNKFLASTGIRNLDHPNRSLVSTLTTISRLQSQEGNYHNHWVVYAENPTEITVWSEVFSLN